MNTRILLAAAAAFSLAALGAADAATKHKRHKPHHRAPVAYAPAAPQGMRTPGPPWAQPWECYTDEGYGRYTPCSSGKDD